MFTAIRRSVWASAQAAVQSMAQMTADIEPLPELSKTRTDQSRMSGAMPTTPMSLSRAPTAPATWDP